MGKVSFWASAIFFIFGATMLSSCSTSPKKVDALIDKNGNPAGVIVEYSSIDKSSINTDTYQVPGKVVSMVFASNTNPFNKLSKEEVNSDEKDDRYVVVLLKDDPGRAAKDNIPVELNVGKKPLPDIRIKQVAPVKTMSGRTVKPWKKAVKAENLFEI